MTTPAELTVIVPLFPRHPGLRDALSSLRAQTRRPDFVLLLDNGTYPEAGSVSRQLPGIRAEVVQSGTANVAEAINHAVEMLPRSEFVAVLTSSGIYLPPRLERCLAAARDPERVRAPGVVVTAMQLIDAQGSALAADDPRRAHLDRRWAPGRAGLAISEWLGSADFVLSASNLFARRAYLAANPLSVDTPTFHYHAAVQAAVQSSLAVVDEPLLEFNWFGPESDPSALGLAGIIRAQIGMLAALNEKLTTSPETRRNLASFHRAAWSNLSGLREDLFMQAVLQLAALATPGDTGRAIDRITSATGLLQTPPFLRALRENEESADPAAYAAALAKARADFADLQEERDRIRRVADAAQDSGWVRFGAWLGDRSARRIMELEEAERNLLQPPDGKIESGGENNPDEVRNKHPRGKPTDRTESAPGQHDGNTEKNDLEKREPGLAQTEEKRSP